MELVLLVGLLRLGVVLGLIVFTVASLGLLLREPARWQYAYMKVLAWMAIAAVFIEVLLGRNSALHLTYGVLTALILYVVSGLEPAGWFRRALSTVPERVGPYYFWASLVGILLWLRFTSTG